MKLKRLIKFVFVAIIAFILIFGILPLFILPEIKIGDDYIGQNCGHGGTALGSEKQDCSCYGIKYNPEPYNVGAWNLKCVGYCPTSSCRISICYGHNNCKEQNETK